MTAALDLRPVFPALVVALTGVAVLLAQAFTPKGARSPAAGLSLAGLVGALAAVAVIASGRGRGSVLAGSLAADDFALFFQALLVSVGILAVLLSPSYLRETAMDRGEYYALMLFSIVGMMGLVSALELVAVFVALEIMSVAIYAMAGLHRDREESQEAALKYFITGSFSSAFLLYGIAVLYGLTGTTSLARIADALRSGTGASAGAFAPAAASPGAATALALIGTGLLLVGFGFKVASVPFHMWAPDAYEGAPTTVTALMAAGVKAAAFGAFLRVFLQALPNLAAQWQPAVAVLAIVTMIVGNLGALAQTNLKRMLAYSSIAHAGYLMTALVAAPGLGTEAILFYLVTYAAVNLGGFGAFAALARQGREPLGLSDVAGLSERRPLLAAALTVFLVSLTGVPISGGFVGKFYLFSAAVTAGYAHLAIVGMVMSVVSAYYYLRVVVAMYMREPVGDDRWARIGLGPGLALAVSTGTVLFLGVYPGPLMTCARIAARSLGRVL
jgi:NADH-quinone oxidoreductase subunit N